MKKLTQEQVEQCARACGWCKDHDGKFYEAFYCDPHFWFPRLWDKLCELCQEPNEDEITGFDIHVTPSEGEFDISIIPLGDVDCHSAHAHPCLALVGAIKIVHTPHGLSLIHISEPTRPY